ncbi:MAG: HAMP domain-containing sensor histidine kinase [Acidobacteriota bacterium]
MTERRSLPPARVHPLGLPRQARAPTAGIHGSVFAKLVAVMVTMATSLLLLVAGFFWLIVSPAVSGSIDRVLEDQARAIAAASPDADAARHLGGRVGLQVRYEGLGRSWATTSDLPSIDEVRQRRVPGWPRVLHGRHYYIVAGTDGGTYLFAWNLPRDVLNAHATLLAGLLLVMVAVVFAAHKVLKGLLRPLRDLGAAVARLGEGDLDVALPNLTRDEFGRLTEAFNRMVGRVRDMINARDQLLLDVSHELRSPLTRMKVALELVDSGKRRGMVADVAEMERMIAGLLELERLRGDRAVSLVRQDLVPLLREVSESLQQSPPGIRLHCPFTEIPADVDAEAIRTVLRNLLENAIKYSLPDSGAIELSAVQNGEHVVIRVTDDGPGIPEHEMPNLFEPFFRVDRSRSKKTGGYGLGLSISKRIVEAHGGTIALENNPSRGASFVVTLPSRV